MYYTTILVVSGEDCIQTYILFFFISLYIYPFIQSIEIYVTTSSDFTTIYASMNALIIMILVFLVFNTTVISISCSLDNSEFKSNIQWPFYKNKFLH